MLRARLDNPARPLFLFGACLLAPLVFAFGVAWACVPTARTALSKVSGKAGVELTMTGNGFPGATQTVKIHRESSGGEVLREATAVPSGDGSERAFSTTISIPNDTAPGAQLLVPVPHDATGNVVGAQLGPAPAAVYQVTNPTLSLLPSSGPPGTRATIKGVAFRSGQVKLRWGSPDGPELGSATATGAAFSFSKQVRIPGGPNGSYKVFAVPFGDPEDLASVAFQVTPAPPPLLVMPPDTAGPAVLGAALTRGNGTVTASRKGVVRIFCGRFTEAGVTGVCGARSTRRLRVSRAGDAARSAVLKLRAKRFIAEQGRPVQVRFRLSKSAMKMLRVAKKVRMRGTVDARDAKGNPTKVPFRFTLKAPKTPERP